VRKIDGKRRHPTLDTTQKSIEEIATTITYRAKLRRHVY
jgi:regulator of PEP synthase PpsR (kinase-PPPase family)